MPYSIAELLARAKAVARGAVPGVGTEEGTDLDLTIHAAARLFQGTQVAAAHVYAQLDPATSDAARRDQLADLLGLSFEKDAAPARGLIAITLDPEAASGGFVGKAGTEITFPGTLFVDGLERTYRLLADATAGGFILPNVKLGPGSGIHKLIPQSASGVSGLHEGSLLIVKTDLGLRSQFAVVKSANVSDQTLDLLRPLSGVVTSASTNRLYRYLNGAVAQAECVTAGKAGNAPATRLDDTQNTVVTVPAETGICIALLLEMSGGGDAVSAIDGDSARVVRLLEDTLAMPPALGNAQHWRELALSCPDVDLDDAIVYQHVRGPGTIDIVCIGRSGSVRASAFPNVNLSFCGWGNNQRRIGAAQAARVRAWCRSQASYFDDIEVRSVEWDWRGNSYAETSFDAFVQASGGLELQISHQDGYGPDCGVALTVTPSARHAKYLYPATGTIDPSLLPGHRVWARVSYMTSDLRHASATVVTEVLSIAGDRSYAEIAEVTSLGPGQAALDGAELGVVQWGTAGPLTEACVAAVYAYYDQLGPGSYLEPPRSAGYVQQFSSAIAPLAPGQALRRWPPESRRWSASVRASELRAALLQIAGVQDVTVSPYGTLGGLYDFDPIVFQTLACAHVVPRSV